LNDEIQQFVTENVAQRRPKATKFAKFSLDFDRHPILKEQDNPTKF